MTQEIADLAGYDRAGGVIITEVTPGGPAARRGIGPGLKLLEINGQAIETPEDVRTVLRNVEDRQIVSLVVGFDVDQIEMTDFTVTDAKTAQRSNAQIVVDIHTRFDPCVRLFRCKLLSQSSSG